MGPKPKDRAGERHGRVIIMGDLLRRNKGKTRIFLCKCDCGHVFASQYGPVKRGKYNSCIKCFTKVKTKHGMARSPEYLAWKAMVFRCTLPRHQAYSYYGGRGIRVCDRWQEFENFYKDMGDRPSKKHSLDRIDNDGDYCPENCRWATKKEQQRNRRACHYLTLNGKTQTLVEWSEEIGVCLGTIRSRLRYGWTIEEALTIPKLRRGQPKPLTQETK